MVPLPGRRGLPIPLLGRGRPGRDFPLPIFQQRGDSPAAKEEDGDKGEDDGGEAEEDDEEEDGDWEEESADEEEDETRTVAAWADAMMEEFMLPAEKTRYRSYQDYPEAVETIFRGLAGGTERGVLQGIAELHGFPPSTISYWRRKWADFPDWRPYGRRPGVSGRVFSDAQEEEIVRKIQTEFWDQHRALSTGAFQDFVKRFWSEHRGKALRRHRFAGSSRFRILFARRHRLSLRKASIHPSPVRRDELAARDYVAAVRAAVRRYGADRVANMDETSWRDVQAPARTLAGTGWATVPVRVRGNVKGAVSAVCTVTCAGRKLPPLYILKGKGERARASLGDRVPLQRVTVSDNGWMTETVMIKYVRWLYVAMGRAPCALVVDTFPGHITPRVRWQMGRAGVELIAVPRGMTGELQPLDLSCFGPLKKISGRLWDRESAREPDRRWSHAEGARLLEDAWPRLKESTVIAGWRFLYSAEELAGAAAESGAISEDDDSDAGDDGEFREPDSDPESEGCDPPSEGTRSACDRRVGLAHQRAARLLSRPDEVPISLHELSGAVDDEEGFLAAEADASETGGRGGGARAGTRREAGRGRPATRGRASAPVSRGAVVVSRRARGRDRREHDPGDVGDACDSR